MGDEANKGMNAMARYALEAEAAWVMTSPFASADERNRAREKAQCLVAKMDDATVWEILRAIAHGPAHADSGGPRNGC